MILLLEKEWREVPVLSMSVDLVDADLTLVLDEEMEDAPPPAATGGKRPAEGDGGRPKTPKADGEQVRPSPRAQLWAQTQ